jgi:hypothetical protein
LEKQNPEKCVLLLLKILYGLKQAAYAFWTLLVETFVKKMLYTWSKADPCLFFKWHKKMPSDKESLGVWMSWVDDLICAGVKYT